ncbi:hypothetical protein M0805_004482 [Coniferiporia weirii]|nr:hypothetical protein M0805_004482 [Coniferiporia weirii]
MSQSGGDSAADQKFLAIKAIEIDFKGNRPQHKVVVKVKSGDETHRSRRFGRNGAVRWDIRNGIYPSLSADLNITVKEKRVLRPGGHSSVFNISPLDVIGKDTFHAQDDSGRIEVALTCESKLSIDSLAKRLVEEAQTAVGEKKVLLSSLGKFGSFLDVIMKLADGITDVHVGSKGAAVLACALFERCKTQQRCHEEAAKLMEELSSFLPFTGDGFPGLMENERTKQVVKKMLELFCDISKLIIKYSSKGILGDLIFSRRDEIGKVTEEFKKLKESFDWYVKAEQWRLAISTGAAVEGLHPQLDSAEWRAEDYTLQRLRPAQGAYYDIERKCMEGTRESVFEWVREWVDSDSKLFWLHGVAGSGKSSIANSVAHMFEEHLFGCFFCKRDDPECRSQRKVFPTLAYHFSKWHKKYRSDILSIIEGKDEPKLSQGLQWQFDLLIKQPLESISDAAVDLPQKPLIVVIDALDECDGEPDSELQIAEFLVKLAGVVPWLKVFVTSRPLSRFPQIFSACKTLSISSELDSNQVKDDILQYTQHLARKLSVQIREDQIDALVLKASGLFIWTSTVFKYIGRQLDVQGAIKDILSSSSIGQEVALVSMYTTVIASVSVGAKNTEIIRTVLGIIAFKNIPLVWIL